MPAYVVLRERPNGSYQRDVMDAPHFMAAMERALTTAGAGIVLGIAKADKATVNGLNSVPTIIGDYLV